MYLASLGCEVVAVDSSKVGMDKATRLAMERGVSVETVVADLRSYVIEPGVWDGIVSVYCHPPSDIRIPLHRAVFHGLRSGGVFLLEAYGARQLDYGTGGPRSVDMLMSLDALRRELSGLHFVHAVETERVVREGKYHDGLGAVVQVVAIKP